MVIFFLFSSQCGVYSFYLPSIEHVRYLKIFGFFSGFGIDRSLDWTFINLYVLNVHGWFLGCNLVSLFMLDSKVAPRVNARRT